jgi:hypothetical protein
MFNKLITSIIIVILGIGSATAQLTWLVNLNVNAEGKDMVLSFGGSTTATDTFDVGLDSLTPPAPLLSYYACFHIDDSDFNNLNRDIGHWESPYEESIDWTLVVTNANGIETTITWDPNELPTEGFFEMVGASNMNMRNKDSVTFEGNKILTIQYRFGAAEPPDFISLQVLNNTNLKLSFSQVSGASTYNIYRETTAYFIPDKTVGTNRMGLNVTDQDPGIVGIQWTDTDNVIGDPSINYFYAVTSVGSSESEPSTHFGEFDFGLQITPTTDFNEIALVLNISDIADAAGLMAAIPGCNSVAYWDASMQGYYQYVPALSFTNFSVEMGYPYYVNITTDTVFTLLGKIATPSFNLVTTSTTDFNEVMLTLDKTSITKASELMADIPNCNSVAFWEASMQGYYQYVPALSFTDFDVRVGYPYYVNVTADIIWPGGGTPKRIVTEPEITQKEEGSKAPHLVFGRIDIEDAGIDEKDIGFRAYIMGRTEDRLNEHSSGCIVKYGYWIVQCGSFGSRWKAGEILRIELYGLEEQYRGEVEVELTYEPVDKACDIILTESEVLPTNYGLSQNYPNPFNPETKIQYQLPNNGKVKITVYNIMGLEVRRLINEYKEAGIYEVIWDGQNDLGHVIASGLYIYMMRSGNFVRKMKAVFLK